MTLHKLQHNALKGQAAKQASVGESGPAANRLCVMGHELNPSMDEMDTIGVIPEEDDNDDEGLVKRDRRGSRFIYILTWSSSLVTPFVTLQARET